MLDAGCRLAAVPGVPAGAWDSLARAPADPAVWVLTSQFAPRLAHSLDDGLSWTEEATPEDAIHFAIDPDDPGAWSFAGRSPALYTRSSVSQRWEARTVAVPEGQGVVSAAAAPYEGRLRWLVGTTTAGPVRSDDGGWTWESATDGLFGVLGTPEERVLAVVSVWVAIAPSDPDIAYAAVNRVGRVAAERGIWRSDDGGRTWLQRVRDGALVDGNPAEMTGGTRVFVSPHDPRRAYFAFGTYWDRYGVDLFASEDGFDRLSVSHFDGFFEIMSLAFGPAGSDVLYVGASSDIPGD